MTKTNPLRPFECYYDTSRKGYLVPDAYGNWINQNEAQLSRRLRESGVSKVKSEKTGNSQVDRAIIHIQDEYSVVYTGGLAGYWRGLHQCCGKKILVTSEPHLHTPFEMPWPTLNTFLTGLLKDDEFDQLPYFYGWLKMGYQAVQTCQHFPGQILVMAGEGGCGKSLAQALITQVLGGRSAKPYRYMMGLTTFNMDLFEAEHLMIEDEAASTDMRARVNFGAKAKEMTVNEVQSCHGKNEDAVSLTPIRRTSITLNNEQTNIMILPPLDASLVDKFIILKAHKKPMPMPTGTIDDRAKFWLKLQEEIPGFLHFLTAEFTIPQHLSSDRFGITHFHHPELIAALNSLSHETRFLSIIDSSLLSEASPNWQGTSEELERTICQNPSYSHISKQIFHWPGACGTYLHKLSQQHPNRVKKLKTTPTNVWQIKLPETHVSPRIADSSICLPSLEDTATPLNGADAPLSQPSKNGSSTCEKRTGSITLS